MRDLVSPRLLEFDRIEGEDRLLDEIQCHAGNIAGLLAIEPPARRIDEGEQHSAGLCNLRLSASIRSWNRTDGLESLPPLRRLDFATAMTQHLLRAGLWSGRVRCLRTGRGRSFRRKAGHGLDTCWTLGTAKRVSPCLNGVPMGIRTPVTAVKGRCPRPLDDGDALASRRDLVELGGIEPPTSCMPCKRSPS
jgi:hypothetical protein